MRLLELIEAEEGRSVVGRKRERGGVEEKKRKTVFARKVGRWD